MTDEFPFYLESLKPCAPSKVFSHGRSSGLVPHPRRRAPAATGIDRKILYLPIL